MKKSFLTLLLVGLIASSFINCSSNVQNLDSASSQDQQIADQDQQENVTVSFQETDKILQNPGIGFTTAQRFEGAQPPDEYPSSTIAYFRKGWDFIEPNEPGQICFDLIDNLIEQAQLHGQTFAFRIAAGGMGVEVPQWLIDLGINGANYQYVDETGNLVDGFMPDFTDPIFMQHMERLIKAFGAKYDGNPAIDHVDIGSMGCWGEWNLACLPSGVTIPIPSKEVRLKYIDWYFNAFPNTPKLMLIADLDGMTYAVKKGSGWRADCLGDMTTDGWNHMNWYPTQIQNANAQDTWKTAPIAFETCWTMQYWQNQGWDAAYILNYALDFHVSVLNAKSDPIPSEQWPAVNDFLKKVGYRLVLSELTHKKQLSVGNTLVVSSKWKNVGVAPPYRAYPLAYRLRDAQENKYLLGKSSARLTEWLPGEYEIEDQFLLSNKLAPGTYHLDIAIFAIEKDEPSVKLAITGRREDGWYPTTELIIE